MIQQLRRIHTSSKTLHEQQGPGSQFIMLDYLWQRWSLSPLDPQESSVHSKYIKPRVTIAQVGMISGESLDMIGPPTAGIFIQIGRTFPLGKDHTVHWQLIFQRWKYVHTPIFSTCNFSFLLVSCSHIEDEDIRMNILNGFSISVYLHGNL